MGTYILYFMLLLFPAGNSGLDVYLDVAKICMVCVVDKADDACCSGTPGCEDSQSDCPTRVANGGNCLSTLGTTCKFSCNNCHIADCGDYHESCASWAASGECTANPAYMLVSCKASCGVECSPETTTVSVTTQQQMTSPPTTMTSLATTTLPTTNPQTTTPGTLWTETATTTSPATTITTQAQTPKTSTTHSPVITTSKQHSCVCTCRTSLFSFNTSDPDTIQMQIRSAVESIKAELKVNKTSLSSTIRTLTCASDDRPSSAAIGWFGAVLLGLVFGTIILADAVKLITYIVS